ncbi:MAG: hypothetical protein ACI915_003828 [Gammaproteobacteria bacterium]|jgi:hypothetical protein
MKRVAKCHCGNLSVIANGEPSPVLMCHCELCQRRTGTSYNLGARYAEGDITAQGETKLYARTGDTNSRVEFYLCPNCGSNVFGKAPEIQHGKVCVAVGWLLCRSRVSGTYDVAFWNAAPHVANHAKKSPKLRRRARQC